MYGKELDIEEFNIQQLRIILFLRGFYSLKPNTSFMLWITPVQEGYDAK